ncbi:MAG: PIN domain-containing protein [Armatimonadetes bacterium]|nr:PIN domain-containing protein [Armatimonadota bacterium]
MVLIDTDILIDIQRGYPGAADWLRSLVDDIGIPAPVAWEMLTGSRHRADLDRSKRFLAEFRAEEVTLADSRLTHDLISTYVLTSGLSLPDYLVAAQCLNRGCVLYTFNAKHYRSVAGLVALPPYGR